MSISGVYGPIANPFGMNVDLWILMSGKILEFSYHGNRCLGDLNNGHSGIEVAYRWL